MKESDIAFVTSTGEPQAFRKDLEKEFQALQAFGLAHQDKDPQALVVLMGHHGTARILNDKYDEDHPVQAGVQPQDSLKQGAEEGMFILKMDRPAFEKTPFDAQIVLSETELKGLFQKYLALQVSGFKAVAGIGMGCKMGALIQ